MKVRSIGGYLKIITSSLIHALSYNRYTYCPDPVNHILIAFFVMCVCIERQGGEEVGNYYALLCYTVLFLQIKFLLDRSFGHLTTSVRSRRLVGESETMPVNVRAPEYVTGGAGGAGAAAVAAGEVSFALDTDHLAGVRVRAATNPETN